MESSQPGDLFLGKLSALLVDIAELEEAGGALDVVAALGRLRAALDVERVIKRFYREFDEERIAFADRIEGIDDERDRRWYTSVILNRLMFIYFLQRKTFLDGGDLNYLQNKLTQSKRRGKDRYYGEFLKALFFEAFAKPEDQRGLEVTALVGQIIFLNGGLFLPHEIENRWPKIAIADVAFDELLKLFGRYTWNLDDTPGGRDDEINPAVLGYIFEKYINQKAFGAYYTRAEITDYLSERTIERIILDRVNTPASVATAGLKTREFQSLPDLLMALDPGLCQELLDLLPKLSLLDPACGSGAFLVAAMKTLISIYSAVFGWIDVAGTKGLKERKAQLLKDEPNAGYYVKKRIITDNLYGVDIMEEAVEIARLRLFLALVASAQSVRDLKPLPNIDFNLLAGNSLVGLLRVDEDEFDQKAAEGGALNQLGLFRKSFKQLVNERRLKLATYRDTTTYSPGLAGLRNEIEESRREANGHMHEILLDDFRGLGIKFEQASWDEESDDVGRSKKRDVRLGDVKALKPFHWGYEFDAIMNEAGIDRGGFDVILTNPPWEIFKPNAKEFFTEYSDLVTKKKMRIEEFEKEQAKLLKARDVRQAWLEYLSRFPHVSAYYRAAPQYANQIAIVNGKRAGSDINLYKLFTEQCYNLLRPGGLCGIVIPSGIYTDLGAKQLREMLFGQAQVTGLFGFENRKQIFEGVHRSFKFVVLTFEKGRRTMTFPAAFMRHDAAELEQFPREGALQLSVELIRRLSPDSLSVMEFKSEMDVQIAEKMLRWPLLGEERAGSWNVSLTREFDMTNDSELFKTKPGAGRLPLYEGKMIWQFEHKYTEPRYWVEEKEGRKALIGHGTDTGQKLDYQACRLGFRDIASSTNERSMISAIIPQAFHGNKIPTVRIFDEKGERLIDNASQVFLAAIWNSFVFDWMLRQKITTTLNFFYLYQMPVPRLGPKDRAFRPIMERSARLICTTSEFDDLARDVELGSRKAGVTGEVKRATLRAELDGLVAHLYGVTEVEFAHILGAFPLVPDTVKLAAQNAYRDVERGLIK